MSMFLTLVMCNMFLLELLKGKKILRLMMHATNGITTSVANYIDNLII